MLDDLAGLVARVGDRVQAGVVGRHEPALDQLIPDELVDLLPVRVAVGIEQDDRHGQALARLHQREEFERLVERAESSRETDERL